MSAIDDPRWAKFNHAGFACSCGETHVGLFPLQMLAPVGWPGSTTAESDEALRMEGDFLSYCYCVREGKYFSVRVRLPLPLEGTREWAFMFTAWVALDRPDFEGYVAARKANTLTQNARAPARLVNRLSTYDDTFRLMGSAYQQNDGGLPYFLTDPQQQDGRNNHPLAIDQRRGISLDRVFEIYAAQAHDMRPAFTSH
jgi:hypothetical protein